MKKTTGLNELNLISEIKKIASATQDFNKTLLIKSIGDDAAVFKDKNSILVSSDSITENVHFKLKYYSFHDIGAKSILVNLSDIAAMGGVPRFFILSLFIPSYITKENIKETINGIIGVAKAYKIALIGGNVSKASEFSICIAIIGDQQTKKSKVIPRYSAKPGDLIFLSGEIGNSWLVHHLLENKELIEKFLEEKPEKRLIESFIKNFILPVPRVKLGMELARLKLADSLTDVSDGIYKDIPNLLNQAAGQTSGANIFIEELPLNHNLKKITGILKIKDYLSNAISFGEDYELLWTSGVENEDKIFKLSKRLKIKINKIGTVIDNSNEVYFFEGKKRFIPDNKTYRHF